MMRSFVRRLSAWPVYRWVLLMVGVYLAIALAGTWANYVDLHISVRQDNIIDLSINQQALASTIHSNKPFPFYEAEDCGGTGRCSLLLVHPVFFAYLIAIPYALWPSALTLFTIQDLALALAALPLFAIARNVTRSNRLALLAAGAYLAWWPAFTAIFSFHWEAFIPLELFLLFWLWLTRRYWYAVPVVMLAYITLEVTTVLIFFVGIFFLLDWFPSVLRYLWTEARYLATKKSPESAARLRIALARVRRELLKPAVVRASLALLLGSFLAYVLLHEFVTNGGGLFGLPGLPAKYSLSLAQPEHDTVFTYAQLSTNWPTKLAFWLVIYGSLAMVPFLAPRTLVLSVPWVVFSVVSAAGYYHMGNHYAFVTAAVVFIGFVYGVSQLKSWAEGSREGGRRYFIGRRGASPETTQNPNATVSGAPTSDAVAPRSEPWAEEGPTSGTHSIERTDGASPTEAVGEPPAALGRATSGSSIESPGLVAGPNPDRRRQRRRRAVVISVLALVIAFNLFLNPFNPLSVGVVADLGQSFTPESALSLNGFDDSSYLRLELLASMIPPNAVVGVSPDIYSFVANDPYAYPFSSPMVLSYLPFNATNGTQYVLYSYFSGHVPTFLAAEIYDSTDFGVRAWIPTTYIGGIWLLQRGYSGPTQVLGSGSLVTEGNFTANHGLVPGPSGVVEKNSTSPSGFVIGSEVNSTNHSRRVGGRVFTGPDVTLPAGTFEVGLSLSGWAIQPPPKVGGSTPVVSLQMSGKWSGWQEANFTNISLPLSWFHTGNWTTLEFKLELPYPLASFVITGVDQRPWFDLQVSYLSVIPVSDP
jgi:uncharacterized membrane protein